MVLHLSFHETLKYEANASRDTPRWSPGGEQNGDEIGLELEDLLGPILEPLGDSFWYHLGAILRPFWCSNGLLGASLLVFY